MTTQTLINFSNLALKIGVNLQVGQRLEIACPIEKSDVAHVMAKQAYALGAEYVRIRWEDEEMEKLTYQNAPSHILQEVPKWLVSNRNELIEKNYCYVAISAENPMAFKDVDPEKMSMFIKARGKALKKYSNDVMNNEIRWCVVSVPTLEWAKQVFPNSKNPEQELENHIIQSMRLNCENPLLEWQNHINLLNKRAKFLNDCNFNYLHFESTNGTNLDVGLCDNHTWLSAKEKASDGLEFVANMPTEELFTAPHRLKTNGVVYSALPLCYNGQIIDNFSLVFKNGKITDYSAKVGNETLKQLIETDEGTHHIGEVALIGKSSPIAQSGILFFNTLFDENASCHLAIGKAYPTTVIGGDKLSIKELKKLGANDSIDHIDFMIGTKDLSVVGVKHDNTKVQLMKNGDWVI